MKGYPLRIARVVLVLLAALGLGVVAYRLLYGLGASTNLSNHWPWGLWIAFDMLCGIALAAGGFMVAALAYVLHRENYLSIVRPAILTAFLGYLLEITAVVLDLGQPHRIIHPIWMWNLDSVLFLVSWCVILATTVLALEFAPVVLEKFRLEAPLRLLRTIQVPLVILGVVMATLHQSALGSIYLGAGHRLDPLWFSPLLPVLFLQSAAAVGLAMVIFESTISAKAFARSLESDVLTGLARGLPWLLGVYLATKIVDLAAAGELGAIGGGTTASVLFIVEVVGGVLLPLVLLSVHGVRVNPALRFTAALLVVLGVVLNRLNVALVGMPDPSGTTYFPRWMEFAVTLGLIASGLLAFGFAVRHFKVFPEHPARSVPGGGAAG
jgi:Ni/Fe-hydrogenase subunit HybB-like protein